MRTPLRLRDTGNGLLDLLPQAEYDWLEPDLQRVSLTIKQVIQQFDTDIVYVHFPTTALASLLVVLEEDDPVEVSTVGQGGMVGQSVWLGAELIPHRVICQMSGQSFRLPARKFLEGVERGPVLLALVKKYLAFTIRDFSQTIACNTFHTVEARASRWLLLIHDQAARAEFAITQDFLAYMLGVRRQTVTVVVGALQTAGLIRVRRGFITVLDRDGLESASCECYATSVKAYQSIVRQD
jgi:CRP-like cAMP-binding protein